MIDTRVIAPAPGAYSYPLLIKRLLLSGVRYQPGQEIVYADKLRYNYITLQERIQRLANVLVAAGVKAGDTVALLDWDSHRALECFFAVPMLGAVLHTVNVRLSAEQIRYTMNHADDKLVLVHDDFLPLMEQLQGELETVEGFIRFSDAQPCATALPVLGELVLHTLNELGTLAACGAEPLLRSGDVYMPITPMFHVHAWGVPYVATALGIKQVYPGRYEPNQLVRLFREEQVTFSHCVPTLLQMMLDSEEGRNTDLTGWKMLLGGSALTQGLAARASNRGIRVHCGYGMSETCPLLSLTNLTPEDLALPMDQQIPLRINAGMPIPLVDLRIVDEQGNQVAHDGESLGEIVVRAPWLTQGYLKEPEQGAALWADGWMHTGDMACINARGVVQIRDRIKDVIKTGGEWISSVALESLISQHPGVDSVAVVGIADAQ